MKERKAKLAQGTTEWMPSTDVSSLGGDIPLPIADDF